jgi:hypothetical protein
MRTVCWNCDIWRQTRHLLQVLQRCRACCSCRLQGGYGVEGGMNSYIGLSWQLGGVTTVGPDTVQ